MPPKTGNDSIIAICVQEPMEDGCSMDFGCIQGDDLRFLHQAFITDTIVNAIEAGGADIRLYHINQPERRHLVEIVTNYLAGKLKGRQAVRYRNGFGMVELANDPWGIRIEQIFTSCFEDGYKHVLVAGSRTPTIKTDMFKTALKMLVESDAVFGPTPEGRYYVIGMSGSYRIRLSEFDWKSPLIYSEVANAFTRQNLAWSELEIWYCVDTSEELEMMVRDINQFRFEGDEQTAHETEKVMERILSRLEP